LTDEELRQKLAACAKCGSCRSVCTLYPERKSEPSVARGKLALIESSLDPDTAQGLGDAIPLPDGRDAAVRDALADCLLCGRCERNCPNQVAVEEILQAGRARQAGKAGMPAWKRFLFGEVMSSSVALNRAGAAAALGQRLFLRKAPTGSGLHYRFPESAGFHGRTIPAFPDRGFVASMREDEGREGDAILFPGCVFDLLMPEVSRAAFDSMAAIGVRVKVPRGLSCCGMPALASGDRDGARKAILGNVATLLAAAPKAVVFPCGSCLTMFRRDMLNAIPAGHPLRPDVETVASRCVDYATFILDHAPSAALRPIPAVAVPGSIGWHDPCHLSGTLGRGAAARELLSRVAGPAFREMAGADRCCGYGGTFNARDYPTSLRLGANKVSLAAAGGTQTIVTACSGCILQLRDTAARACPGVRVRHLAELVRAALAP
jgi:glycolate oxidase iron-sulfur subunit